MPLITIEMFPQEYEKKAEIAKVFTDELNRITGIPKEPISIVFHDLTPEHVATAGVMVAEKHKDSKLK